jgi:cytochrome c-type biogenesis protein CcmH
MNAFVLVAALLALAVIVPLLYPLLKREGQGPNAALLAVVVTVGIGGGAALLYPLWSNWKWSEPAPAADSPAAMIGRLARRLEKQPDDLNGWLLLGKSYAVVEQFPLAARAYQRADALAKGQNGDALMGWGDALINGGLSDFSGRAGRLFEKALELDPNSVKALFYSAISAMERNELPLARARFARLLAGNPPPEVQRVIQQQISNIDAQMRLASNGSAAGAEAGSAPVAPASQSAAAATVSVPLRITLSRSVADKAAAGAPLFVLARIPGQRGPPLAAKRLDAKFPQDVELLNTDAMISGTGFTAGQEIEVEARIANGGSAISRTGDPFGSVRVKAGSGQRTAIEINQLKP